MDPRHISIMPPFSIKKLTRSNPTTVAKFAELEKKLIPQIDTMYLSAVSIFSYSVSPVYQ
jgi:hypothetical protein